MRSTAKRWERVCGRIRLAPKWLDRSCRSVFGSSRRAKCHLDLPCSCIAASRPPAKVNVILAIRDMRWNLLSFWCVFCPRETSASAAPFGTARDGALFELRLSLWRALNLWRERPRRCDISWYSKKNYTETSSMFASVEGSYFRC